MLTFVILVPNALLTDLLGAEAPLEPTADAPAVKFTEEQARQWLAAHGTQSVRLLAKLWGWHPSKVQRLLNRVRAETVSDTPADTPRASSTVSAETPETPQAPFARAPYQDDFDWSPENEAVIVAPQEAIAVYRNVWNQIVIRAEDADDGVDAFVRISPEHLPRLIAALTRILEEGDR